MTPDQLPERRFRFLVTKKPLGELTPEEIEEIDYYIALFRHERSELGILARTAARILESGQQTMF